MFGRKKTTASIAPASTAPTNGNLVKDSSISQSFIRRATKPRLSWTILTSLFLLTSVVFLILVEIGNVSADRRILTNIYFIRIDLTNIVPVSVPNAVLINSIARTLGLHDYYTVGLWNYCEGYNGSGTSGCSSPQTLYWFNPVEIIASQLLAGATIALPAQLTEILGLIETVSHWMFGLFLAGACLSFVLIFIVPLSYLSRWATLPIAIFTFLNALFITVAAIIATVMFIIMRNVFNNATDLNIGASIGKEMFAFMWIAAAFSILAWLIQMGQLCCCASKRDVRTGRKRGSSHAYGDGVYSEKRQRRGLFGRHAV